MSRGLICLSRQFNQNFMPTNEKKERDRKFGQFAEQKAAEYYLKNDYAILERNWRLSKIEIDLIVQRNNTIVFVEVKARSGDDESPVSAVTTDKMKRMIRASDVYIRSQKGDYDYRFDIVGLTGDFNNYEMEVYEDAFVTSDVM